MRCLFTFYKIGRQLSPQNLLLILSLIHCSTRLLNDCTRNVPFIIFHRLCQTTADFHIFCQQLYLDQDRTFPCTRCRTSSSSGIGSAVSRSRRFSAPPMSSPLLFRRLCTSASENHHGILLSSYLFVRCTSNSIPLFARIASRKAAIEFSEFRSFYHAALYAPTVFL